MRTPIQIIEELQLLRQQVVQVTLEDITTIQKEAFDAGKIAQCSDVAATALPKPLHDPTDTTVD